MLPFPNMRAKSDKQVVDKRMWTSHYTETPPCDAIVYHGVGIDRDELKHNKLVRGLFALMECKPRTTHQAAPATCFSGGHTRQSSHSRPEGDTTPL